MIKRLRTTALMLVALTLMGVGFTASVSAQEATPQASPDPSLSEGYPVAIHQGSCDSPGSEAAWQLDNAISVGSGDEESEPTVVGPEITTTVSQTSGAVEYALDDLANNEHVVAVHASDEEFGTVVACGQVAGVKEDGRVVVALAPVGENTVAGIAILEEDGDNQTQVTVYVFDQALDDSGSGM
jgi:hypothetical protein